ncbi:transferase [Daldinia decipiens]|uniref:transferase n=1 Tax=Daldinia decipiens TaxID=326647 RepID=UPI0020C4DEC8|nr:transferase [Daldinia decipiens]KAI1661084.1 transferase [Daldinia decipiens]
MVQQQVFHLHPHGWEDDPEEERYKVSTLDYLSGLRYNNYALFFRLDDDAKRRVASILKEGLERTISQARHVCGTIEKDSEGGHSFVKKRDSTVQFVVQWLDSSADNYPSFDDLYDSHFSTTTLGPLETWSVYPMTAGDKPEAHPDNSPAISAFKANFIRGGLVFNMHHHHYANDVLGWTAFTHQLAENCYALVNGTPFPAWDPIYLDRSRVTKKEFPESAKVDGPVQQERHPAHTMGIVLLFHLPKSKAAELKKLAMPANGSQISTYDAFSAFIWRTFSRLRAPVFNPDPSSNLFWAEAVDMRRRFHSPECPERTQGNIMFAVRSTAAPVQQPTIAEIISEWPLPKLASYIRKLTNCVTQDNLDKTLDIVALIRDKTALNARVDSHPPMSILQTDHRRANVAAADFGFGKPITYRHLWDDISVGVILIYPPRSTDPDSDEGCEFAVMYEKNLAQTLIEDPEWNRYFEYRGVTAEHRCG